MFNSTTVLGRTFSTVSSFSSSSESFYFWVDKSADFKNLEPGTVVAVKEGDDICFAVIEGIEENMDYSTPLEAFASHNFGDANYDNKTDRFVCQAVRAKILKWLSGSVRPVSGEKKVLLSTALGLKYAFGIPEKGVPVGFSSTPTGNTCGQASLVRLPDSYLFGVEAQGINIGGQTGYAKTNLALNVALLSLFNLDDFCVIGINVKGEDLLWLDKINPDLSNDDKNMWKSLGLTAISWLNFELFAPAGISLRRDGKEQSFLLSWKDIRYELNLLFSESKEDENARILVSHIAGMEDVESFDDALKILSDWQTLADNNGNVPGRHHAFTIRKVIKMLESLCSRKFINKTFKKPVFPDLLKVIKPKSFITFDLNDSLMTSTAQKIIFQKILFQVRELLENKILNEKTGVKRVLFFVDELSKYAYRSMSSESFLSGVKSGVKNIAERGRFAGLSLLGVEQYPSQIDDNILSNMSTQFLTRLKSKELSNEIYKYYPKEFVRSVSRLNKGIALLDHDTFPEPLFIRFPRSICATSAPDEKIKPKNVSFGIG